MTHLRSRNHINKQAIYNNCWLQLSPTVDHAVVSSNISKVCQQNQQQRRWILCIDVNDQDLYSFAKNIDKNKLLRVNGEKQPISFDKIATTLLRGNCSTVIVGANSFTQNQLTVLLSCAKHGNTECIIAHNRHVH